MGKTVSEKIFSLKTKKDLFAGDTVFAPVDYVMGTDGTVPLSVKIFRELGIEKVKNPDSLIFVNDHFVPAKDIASAELSKVMRDFAKEQNVKHYFEVGKSGICHVVVPEMGLIKPGDIVVGADSHTCTYGALGLFATGIGSTDMACVWATGELWFKVPETIKVVLNGKLQDGVYAKDLILDLIGHLGVDGANYKAMEFVGEGLKTLSMDSRLTISNMVVEMGAKAGIIAADEITKEYYQSLGTDIDIDLKADDDAVYDSVIEIDLSKVEATIACPYDPANTKKAKELKGKRIDQVVIGSCTNGRVEDFRVAHSILKGKKIADSTRVILIPGSPKVYKQMVEENLICDFIDAGCSIGPPTCGPCIGGHMGVLAQKEVGLFTTNRNFVGRNGHKESEVYLCSPSVAAYSALAGYIDTNE